MTKVQNDLITAADDGHISHTRLYALPADDYADAVVCKNIFMSTLGLNCDKIIRPTAAVSRRLCENVISVTADKRGKQEPANKLQHLITAGKNATYISPVSQNQIIDAIAAVIRRHIVAHVKSANCFCYIGG